MNMTKTFDIKRYIYFLILVVITVGVTHFSTPVVSSVWYLLLLVLYYFSDDEPLWLVLFLVTVDGFMGFLGFYSTTLEAVPGMPGVEVVQLYFLVSLGKVILKKKKANMFYGSWMKILLWYTLFLILYGFAHGLDGDFKIFMRIIKMILPLILFYTVPRLINTAEGYARLFSFLFLVVFFALLAQLISLTTGFNPGIYAKQASEIQLEVGRNFRVLYNEGITLLSLSGALYYLSLKSYKPFNDLFLYLIIGLTFSIAFLSATRGWILSFGFMTLVHFLLFQKMNPRLLIAMSIFAFSIVGALVVNDSFRTQVQFTFERLLTLESLASGDLTADGTLIRLDERGPQVMSVWEENPVFGAGFSDVFLEAQDFHVGNQNILMHAGIVGFILFLGFLGFFVIALLRRYRNTSRMDPYRLALPTFVILLSGWFFLHSSSQQLFAYYGMPVNIIPQAIFFGLAGFTYSQSLSFRQPDRMAKA
jgi:hypothetical protein